MDEGHLTTLLAEALTTQASVQATLEQRRAVAREVDPELSRLAGLVAQVRSVLQELKRERSALESALAEGSERIASLRQEVAVLRRKADDTKAEMDRLGSGPIFLRLRRDRARVLVQIEDRDKEMTRLSDAAEQHKRDLAACSQRAEREKDEERTLVRTLDQVQAKLPKPHLLLDLGLAQLGAAHCELQLSGNVDAWIRDTRLALSAIVTVHEDLRAGRYRLDRHSDVVGGRATASAEGLHLCVALGEFDAAQSLFNLIADPALQFDHVFNVFRVFCVGYFVTGERDKLNALLGREEFATGLRGGYVEAYQGLLRKDLGKLARGLRAIVKHESEIWRDPRCVRGAGMVNLGAVALLRLAFEAGLQCDLPGPTTPEILVKSWRRTKIMK